MFFDSHAHLTSDALYPDLEEILRRAKEVGVAQIVNICTDLPTLERGLELHNSHPWVLNAGATTPHDVEKEGEELFPRFAKAAKEGDLIAVGETGLDYYYTHSAKKIQQDFLRRYLNLALECALPVIIHCRDAFEDFFRILDEEYIVDGKHAPGVLHCFTGTVDEAKEVLKRGWYLSLSGIATFKRSEELREVARITPLNQLLIETDAPYLAPQGHRGKRNEPAFLPTTAQILAEAKDLSCSELADQTAKNAKNLFKI